MQKDAGGGGQTDGSVAREPEIRLRDIARSVGITERPVQRIVSDPSEAGYVETERIGRRNRYRVNRNLRMRHPAQTNLDVGDLLDLLTDVEPA